ncbi:pyridoxamine 5'-phosphate oxidase family protein [Nitrososphaera sp.]|uniref:pyridoxamine 5'-phosphate oxidase family protein n=1 Tax=Nitrososphaera sp. TaxID=1971748 RepID=UPI0017E7FFE1|nr:pyridoxamine 5'-phosphate oxidase family protein [Nitrososphaera sp.]NWG36803.1 pyridoxamine 5'-phosphate oxidase family protein [Nitrososphaera sp.]
MKILRGMPDMGRAMTEDDVNRFLESKLNLQIATIDEKGDPVIQPVWFLYDKTAQKIYFDTGREAKKLANIRRKPRVYFSIDTEEYPYKCVKGKADTTISENPAKNAPIVEKICTKYLGSTDHPLAKSLVDMAKNGVSVVLELTPKYYTAWDFAEG